MYIAVKFNITISFINNSMFSIQINNLQKDFKIIVHTSRYR